MPEEAAVWISPKRRGGEPCIYGHRLPTAQVAQLVWSSGIDTVRGGWSELTDEQILVACWYEVTHGNRRKWRKRFSDWPLTFDRDQWLSR
jgi:uncharacterized protein (DUF433 family)